MCHSRALLIENAESTQVPDEVTLSSSAGSPGVFMSMITTHVDYNTH